MIAEQEQSTCVQSPVQNRRRTSSLSAAIAEPHFNPAHVTHDQLFEFAANAPATLAERHPRLTVLAISAAVLSAAIALEISCLSGSGYFWR
ncbi:hypothetical protein [Occallatibacter savannae]|uniref:hypothetical protein n=1 Tax=Occallatibacter savannae TaxID=1002691 RepID=UPI000D6923B3|nr:hypothetical protein [Occallatibacter savannae]